MDPILVDVAQLRALQFPAINLTVGRVMMARVIEVELGGRGLLSIAGARVAASLPPGVHAGDELRLVVRDVAPERLVLGLAPLAQPREPEVRERDGEGGAPRPASRSLALCYQTETLGPMDLRFDLFQGGALNVTVRLDAEEAQARARERVGELQTALRAALGTDIGVTIAAPLPPLDTYA